MNNKGFVTSALMYGILSIFLILILGVFSVIGNRKLTNDKIKQSALDDVQGLTTDASCFTVEQIPGLNGDNDVTITKYNYSETSELCSAKTVYIPEKINGKRVIRIGEAAFKDLKLDNVTIRGDLSGDTGINYIHKSAFIGNAGILFIIKGDKPMTYPDDSVESGTLWGATNYSIRID